MRKLKNGKISDGRETLLQFIERKAAQRSVLGRKETSKNYLSLSRCLVRYCGDGRPTLYLEDIDAQFAKDFEQYLRRSGVCPSTISFYNRIFRSLYNQAVQDGLVTNAHPFENAYTKVTAVRRFEKVMTPEGSVLIDTLPREELLRRYRQLAVKYDTLVGKIAELARV